MTVGDLKKWLAKEPATPDDTLIILSSDSEGNSFSPMFCVYSEYYRADSTYSGELVGNGVEEEDTISNGPVPCVAFFPVR